MRTSWANQPFAALAEIAVGPESPTNEAPPPRVILTPPAPKEPRIHGPKVYGVRPGSPFLFRIPCTGVRPITFEASGLPEGLALDAARGVITGRTSRTGTHMVTLRAHNAHGEARRELRIVVGDRIALTPPMGWNHWYAHYDRVTDALVRQAVDIMSTNGMADVGYQYVCIDDCWMNAPATGRHQSDPQRVGPARDEQGRLRPNVHFPDMKALTDYIHAHGLKAGIYSSPGPNTCAGFYGSFGHEEIDARTFAEWGFDLLKYDWCSYGRAAGVDFRTAPLGEVQKPYRIMGELLRRQPRDILFNLCQYGRREVWRWGAEVGGHSWRTGGDLGYELHRIFEVALNNFALREFNRPGAWNDPDYIQIGWIAHPNDRFALQPAPLTPNECHAFMSLWCLMAAPLFYSGDLARLDEFTLSILCNPELIEINQDPLGECGEVLGVPAETFVVVKRMEDGSRAIGLCNRDFQPRRIAVRWADLGLSGRQRVRDAWRGRDLGVFAEGYEAVVPERFVEVLRMWPDSTP
jgi:alpha-galactosidase